MPSNNIVEIETRLKDLISSKFKQMEANVSGSLDKFTQKNKQSSAAVKKLGKSSNSTASQIKNFAKRFGPAALAVGGLSLVVLKLKSGLDSMRQSTDNLEKMLSKAKAILNPTAADFAALSEKAKELGSTTAFTATQAAEAFVELGKLGLTTNQILKSSAEVLNIAAAADVELAEAAIATAQTLKQFSLDADQAQRVTDVMAKSFTTSALDMNKFSESMKFAGPTAAQLGFDLEETTAALSALANQGVAGSMAGTALRRIMLELGDASSDAGKMIGLTADDTRTLAERFQALQDQNLSPAKIKATFGLLATTSAGILIKGSENIKKFDKALNDAEGTAKKMAETMLDNVAGASIKLKSAQEGLAIAFGETFSNVRLKMIQSTTSLVQKLTNKIKLLRATSGEKENLLTSEESIDKTLKLTRAFKDATDERDRLNKKIENDREHNKFLGIFNTSSEVQVKLMQRRNVEDRKILSLQEQLNVAAGKGAVTEKQNLQDVINLLEFKKQKLLAVNDADPTVDTTATTTTTKSGGSTLTDEQKDELAKTAEQRKKDDAAWFEWHQERGEAIVKTRLLNAEKKEKAEEKALEKELKIRTRALKKEKAEEEKAAKALERLEKKKQRAREETALLAVSAFSSVTDAMGLSAKKQKKIATVETIMHGILAVQKALSSAPPPYNFIQAGLVGVAAAANVASIQAQGFETGGMIPGKNTLIRTNEAGTESILNARATTNQGIGGINALNSGQEVNNNTTNHITYAPNIAVNGGASSGLVEALATDKEGFAEFFLDLQRKNFLEGV